MFNVQALAMFNAEQEDVPPAHRCAPAAQNVHVLSAAYFKLNAFVVMAPYHGSVTRAILDTVAGPNMVRESFPLQKWKNYRKPLGFKFNIVDANDNRMLPLGKISLTVKLGNSHFRTSFLCCGKFVHSGYIGMRFHPSPCQSDTSYG